MWFYLLWQPFLNYANWFVDHHAIDGRTTPTYAEIAEAAQTTIGKLHNAARNGQMTFDLADHVACKLGVHPSLIWGDLYWQTLNQIVAHADEQRQRKLQRQAELRRERVLVPCS